MKIAHDLFAETNPAFGTFVLVSFCRNYSSDLNKSLDIGLLYLAAPIAMSDDTQTSFEKTNATTGLLAWLNRFPEIRYDLAMRLDAAVPIVSASLKLGLASRALQLWHDGTIRLGTKVPPKSAVEGLSVGPKQVIRRAERLGGWMGKAGASSSVFSAFGVVP